MEPDDILQQAAEARRRVSSEYGLERERTTSFVRERVVETHRLAMHIVGLLTEREVPTNIAVTIGRHEKTWLSSRTLVDSETVGWVMEEGNYATGGDSIGSRPSQQQSGNALLTDGRFAFYRGNSPAVWINTINTTFGFAGIIDLSDPSVDIPIFSAYVVGISYAQSHELRTRGINLWGQAGSQVSRATDLKDRLVSFAIKQGLVES